MAYPVIGTNPAPGYHGSTTPYPSSYSGTFIPEIWSTKLIDKYYDSTVLNSITNTDYEGEITAHGDKVIIRKMPTVSIKQYQIGQELETEFPEGDTTELLIDKGLYYQTAIDDVIAKQQDINQVNLWAADSAEQLKIELDTEVLAYMPAQAHAQNQGHNAGRISGNLDLGTQASAIEITRANVLDQILYMGQALDEQNAPETGRFILLPYWVTTLLKMSDLKDASLTGDRTSPYRNGLVGIIDRFTVYNSNLLPRNPSPSAGEWSTVMLAGHKSATTFATQMTKTETMRTEKTFGNLMRGLVVYGYKVLKSEALVTSYVTPDADNSP